MRNKIIHGRTITIISNLTHHSDQGAFTCLPQDRYPSYAAQRTRIYPFFVHTYLVQALSTTRILFDTIHAMTLKEGILYKMAIIIMMTIAQISLMDSFAKKIYNSLELISEFSPSVAWMSLMLLETQLDITLHLELLIGKLLSMFIGHFKKNPMLAIS